MVWFTLAIVIGVVAGVLLHSILLGMLIAIAVFAFGAYRYYKKAQ
jgi:hypothetical protein